MNLIENFGGAMNKPMIDWTTATVDVTVEVQHTATTDRQVFKLTLAQLAAFLFDEHSKAIRESFAKQAVGRLKHGEGPLTDAD